MQRAVSLRGMAGGLVLAFPVFPLVTVKNLAEISTRFGILALMLVRTTSRDRCTFPLSYLVPARRKEEAPPTHPRLQTVPLGLVPRIFYYLHLSPPPLPHISKSFRTSDHRQEHTFSPLNRLPTPRHCLFTNQEEYNDHLDSFGLIPKRHLPSKQIHYNNLPNSSPRVISTFPAKTHQLPIHNLSNQSIWVSSTAFTPGSRFGVSSAATLVTARGVLPSYPTQSTSTANMSIRLQMPLAHPTTPITVAILPPQHTTPQPFQAAQHHPTHKIPCQRSNARS